MIDLKQEKLDEMRQDMLEELRLREDDDYFLDRLQPLIEQLDDIRFKIENECELYGRDADYWFQFLTEK